MRKQTISQFAHSELANRKNELVKALKKAFKLSGLSHLKLGAMLNVSNTTIGKVNRGAVDDVSLDRLYIIAVGMGLSVNMKVVCVQQ